MHSRPPPDSIILTTPEYRWLLRSVAPLALLRAFRQPNSGHLARLTSWQLVLPSVVHGVQATTRTFLDKPVLVPARAVSMTIDFLRIAALIVPCLLGLWTAVACRRAHLNGLPGSDALVWAGLSAVFFLVALTKTARGLGLLRGLGNYVRDIFKQRGLYEDRRFLQIAASIAVAVVVMVLLVWGLHSIWHHLKRYRLAVGFAGLTVGFGLIRIISLHEIDAWNASAPWMRTVVDLIAAAGVSALAVARLVQLNASGTWRYWN